jgi:uncharacterized membrane protein
MATTDQEIVEEQREILQEVREIKSEVKSPSVAGRLFVGSLAGAVVGVTWMHRGTVAGLGKSLASRGPWVRSG